MKKLYYAFLLLFLTASGALFGQANVLIIDFNNGFNSDQQNNSSRVYNRLQATQNSVNRVNSIPVISNATYDQVWVYGNPGTLNATNTQRLVNFINGGGAVYMQSEVSCCDNMAALVQAVMQATVAGGGSMTHNPNESGYYRWTTGASASCPGITHHGAAARRFVGVPAQNHLFIAQTGCSGTLQPPDVVGVFFRSCDMTGNQGGLVSAGDFNMFISSGTCSSTGIIGTTNRNDMIDMIATLMGDLVNCGTCGVVLPVQYSDFSVAAAEDKVHIDWTTSQESGNAYFTVERSRDGSEFSELERVRGAGESSRPISYRVVDPRPMEGTSYYRLSQTDFNGRTTYSEIKTVHFGGWGSLYTYHVKDDRRLVVQDLPDDMTRCELLTATGQLVETRSGNVGTSLGFDTSSLSPGVYLVRVFTRSGRAVVKKVAVFE